MVRSLHPLRRRRHDQHGVDLDLQALRLVAEGDRRPSSPLSLSRGSNVASTGLISRASDSRSKSRDRPSREGRHAIVDDAAPHLRKVGEIELRCRHRPRPPVRKASGKASKRSVLNSASMSRRTASRSTRADTTMPRLSSSARWRLWKSSRCSRCFCSVVSAASALDRPRAAGQQRIQTLGAELVAQRLVQSVDFRRQARADR